MRTGPWLPGPEPFSTDRPDLPGYGLAPADGGEGLLPWSWAVEKVEHARNYWVATSSPSGVPHLAAVWGVWVGGALYFSTGKQTVKARNLAASARCVVSTEGADEAVVVHGVAERVGDPAAVDYVRKVYVEKYGEGFPDATEEPLFAVAPRIVVGTMSDPARFTTTATRWHFATIDG
ncbi:MAG: pyridoxamine 5'-phosphate oxidase family protein [Mycobacteriales bacterium]